MKSFTIFEEYYELITLLGNEQDEAELLLAIVKYMFEDIEPELNDRQMKVFKNLKRPLIVSKTKSKAKLNKNQKEIKKKSKRNQNTMSDTSSVTKSMSMSMSNNNKFIKPSIEEVKEYCKERNNKIDANAFYDFYESKGWKVGNQSMKNWKACVRTWEQRNKKQDNVPEWFDNDFKTTESTVDLELKELIKSYE